MDFILRILKVGLIVVILAVVANDVWHYVGATYELGNVTREAAARSVAEVRPSGADRGKVWQAGETYAQKSGATIYGFDMTDQNVHIWTRMPVVGTLLVHRLLALVDGKPQDTLLIIEDDTSIVIPMN